MCYTFRGRHCLCASHNIPGYITDSVPIPSSYKASTVSSNARTVPHCFLNGSLSWESLNQETLIQRFPNILSEESANKSPNICKTFHKLSLNFSFLIFVNHISSPFETFYFGPEPFQVSLAKHFKSTKKSTNPYRTDRVIDFSHKTLNDKELILRSYFSHKRQQ